MKRVGIIAGVSFLAGCIFFALTFGYIQRGNQVDEPFLSPGIAHAVETEITGLNFAPLVKRVKPAVVKVLSESIVQGRRFGDDFFDRFFREPQRRQRVSGEGSGFFISKDGYIITNNHVVKDSVKVRIIDINKNEYPAKIIG